jgi:hypothetical protein
MVRLRNLLKIISLLETRDKGVINTEFGKGRKEFCGIRDTYPYRNNNTYVS